MPKLKVGDKFIYTKEMNEAKLKSFRRNDASIYINKTLTVASLGSDDTYSVEEDKYNEFSFLFDVVDAFIPRTEITWDNLEVGDVLIDDDAEERKVLAVVGEIVFTSRQNDHERSENYYCQKELQEEGWTIKQPEQPKEETLQIGEYTYRKSEVEEKLKDLKPIT